MSMELDKLFNHTCAFPGLNQVLRGHGSKIAGVVATMRGNAELLCTALQQKPLEVTQESEYYLQLILVTEISVYSHGRSIPYSLDQILRPLLILFHHAVLCGF